MGGNFKLQLFGRRKPSRRRFVTEDTRFVIESTLFLSKPDTAVGTMIYQRLGSQPDTLRRFFLNFAHARPIGRFDFVAAWSGQTG